MVVMQFRALYFYQYNVIVQRVTYFEKFIMGSRYLCGRVHLFVYYVKYFTEGCVYLSEVFNMEQRVLYLCKRLTFYITCT
jgi:hypothetical protein